MIFVMIKVLVLFILGFHNRDEFGEGNLVDLKNYLC